MTAFPPTVVQHSINQLLINTINDAEKILLDLPQDGDRVEVITASDEQRVIPVSSKPCKTASGVVKDTVTSGSSGSQNGPKNSTDESSSSYKTTSSESLRSYENKTEAPKSQLRAIGKSLPSEKAQIMPGSVQVSPLRQMEGVMIDLIVMIKMKSGGSRTMNMQIECPQFQPKRIGIDGQWHRIT